MWGLLFWPCACRFGFPNESPHWTPSESPQVQKHSFWVQFSMVYSSNFRVGSLYAHAISGFLSANIGVFGRKNYCFWVQKLVCLSAKIPLLSQAKGKRIMPLFIDKEAHWSSRTSPKRPKTGAKTEKNEWTFHCHFCTGGAKTGAKTGEIFTCFCTWEGALTEEPWGKRGDSTRDPKWGQEKPLRTKNRRVWGQSWTSSLAPPILFLARDNF